MKTRTIYADELRYTDVLSMPYREGWVLQSMTDLGHNLVTLHFNLPDGDTVKYNTTVDEKYTIKSNW